MSITPCRGCGKPLDLFVPTSEPILTPPPMSGLAAVDCPVIAPTGGNLLVTLFFECAHCGHPVHRYPVGHHLRVEADDRLNARDRSRDLTLPQTPVRAGGVQTPARTGPKGGRA